MKYLIPIFFLVLSLNVANAQNEQLIRDIRSYIAKIDSLRNCCWFCFEVLAAGGVGYASKTYRILSPANKLDSILCNENNVSNFEWERMREGSVVLQVAIYHSHYFGNHNNHSNIVRHFRKGKIVAIRKQTEQGETTLLYINEGRVIYHEGTRRDVRQIMRRHNLRF